MAKKNDVKVFGLNDFKKDYETYGATPETVTMPQDTYLFSFIVCDERHRTAYPYTSDLIIPHGQLYPTFGGALDAAMELFKGYEVTELKDAFTGNNDVAFQAVRRNPTGGLFIKTFLITRLTLSAILDDQVFSTRIGNYIFTNSREGKDYGSNYAW